MEVEERGRWPWLGLCGGPLIPLAQNPALAQVRGCDLLLSRGCCSTGGPTVGIFMNVGAGRSGVYESGRPADGAWPSRTESGCRP